MKTIADINIEIDGLVTNCKSQELEKSARRKNVNRIRFLRSLLAPLEQGYSAEYYEREIQKCIDKQSEIIDSFPTHLYEGEEDYVIEHHLKAWKNKYKYSKYTKMIISMKYILSPVVQKEVV